MTKICVVVITDYTELREGNKVTVSSKCVTVKEVFENTALVELSSGETVFFHYDRIDPVPLSGKMLIDHCGYIKLFEEKSCTYGNGIFVLDQGDGSFLSIPAGDRFYYLHQLQNLYLKMTGNELLVNFDLFEK